jgi:hypothetical protein
MTNTTTFLLRKLATMMVAGVIVFISIQCGVFVQDLGQDMFKLGLGLTSIITMFVSGAAAMIGLVVFKRLLY